MLFMFKFVFLRLSLSLLYHFWTFTSLCSFRSSLLSSDPYPVLFLPFLRSGLGCARLPWLNGGRSNGTRSVAGTVERRFYNESLYLSKRLRLPHCIEELPFSFTRCQVLRRGGAAARGGGAVGAVSKAFCVLLPAIPK